MVLLVIYYYYWMCRFTVFRLLFFVESEHHSQVILVRKSTIQLAIFESDTNIFKTFECTIACNISHLFINTLRHEFTTKRYGQILGCSTSDLFWFFVLLYILPFVVVAVFLCPKSKCRLGPEPGLSLLQYWW